MSIWEEAQGLEDEMVARRRNLHQHPETGWTEFRTSSMVIHELESLGYDVSYGAQVVDADAMMGVPSKTMLEEHAKRAISEGADPAIVKKESGGKTGVVGVLDSGKPGKTVAFRFDMDCNDVVEDPSQSHTPTAEGFASKHPGEMHACGHDGHTTIGLGFAKLLMQHKDELHGKVKLIFQPAEEGVRGAAAMAAAGVVDDVDYLFGGHIGLKLFKNNQICVQAVDTLATTKIDAHFTGLAAHAGAVPEKGKNALLAAAQAAVSLSGIARHSGGASRINVGTLNAGTGRNVIPDRADMQLETRGSTSEVNDYMHAEADRMLKACAMLYDVKVDVKLAGQAPSCNGDDDLAAEAANVIEENCGYDKVIPRMVSGASEDCCTLMQRVEDHGGKAIYMMYGAEEEAGHHNPSFNFDESVLWHAVATLTVLALHFTAK